MPFLLNAVLQGMSKNVQVNKDKAETVVNRQMLAQCMNTQNSPLSPSLDFIFSWMGGQM